MKKIFKIGFVCLLAASAASCGSSKKTVVSQTPVVQSSVTTTTSLEGKTVTAQSFSWSDVSYKSSLSDDGASIVKRAYVWFAGTQSSQDRQMAIEMAQREAYATIARVVETMVSDSAGRAGLQNDDEDVKRALKSTWSQASSAILNGCEPFDDVVVEYDQTTKKYTAIAKVAILGTKYNEMLESAKEIKPQGLNNEQLKKYIEYNNAIFDAAKIK